MRFSRCANNFPQPERKNISRSMKDSPSRLHKTIVTLFKHINLYFLPISFFTYFRDSKFTNYKTPLSSFFYH